MYKCKYFEIHELVPKNIYVRYGEKAWQFLDIKALITLDRLRAKYGKITVNNYYWDGDRQWSGLRTPESYYYSKTSQHSYGRAFDCLFSIVTAEKVRKDILNAPNDFAFEFINAIEDGVSWLHFDTRNCDRIKVFRP